MINKPAEKNRNSGGGYPRREEARDEFDQNLVEIRRVTRVTGGGKDLNFRACVVVGDKKGKVGMGVAKGSDVSIAVNKAVNQAKKKIMTVPISEGTVPHEIRYKFKAAKVLLRPARKGRGIIAGGAVRVVLEMAGYEDVISKIQGSASKMNNVAATLGALAGMKERKPRKAKAGEKEIDAAIEAVAVEAKEEEKAAVNNE